MSKLTKEVHEKVLKKYRKGTQTYLAYAYLVRGNRLSTGELQDLQSPSRRSTYKVPIKDRTLNTKTREKEYWIEEV